MKVTNVDKLRGDIFKAIDGTVLGKTEHTACMWKHGYQYRASMDDVERWEMVGDTHEVVSLPSPLHLVDLGIAVTVDFESVRFWDTTIKTHYECKSLIPLYWCDNRMELAMLVMRDIMALRRERNNG